MKIKNKINALELKYIPERLSIATVNRQYRTSKVNQVFYLTPSTSRGNSYKRKNPSTKIVNGTCFVAGTGLTPSFHAVVGPFGELKSFTELFTVN